MVTERQAEILSNIVKEYIKSARPVSSQLLGRKYNLKISPATIRIEMQRLTDKGYLLKPHISAGRVPTDKGFRFFVDKLLEEGIEEIEIENWFLKEEVKGEFSFLQKLTKRLAQFSKTLVLSYLKKEKIFWKEGWEEILKEPEFRDENFVLKFFEFLKDVEREIENIKVNSEIKIYIGRENPLRKTNEFSLILSKCNFKSLGETTFSLFGPVRMNYNKNIGILKSIKKILERL